MDLTSTPPAAPKHYLSGRENWQAGAIAGGSKTRDDVADVLRAYLDAAHPGAFEVTKEPADLKQLYYYHDWKQRPETYADPTAEVWWDEAARQFLTRRAGKAVPATGGGCTPDVKLLCKATGRAYFIECKHQNDAGNAHERAAKYATPSILGLIQEMTGCTYHPVGYLFSGSMVEKRKYQLELRATFAFAGDHLFLWDAARTAAPLTEWVERVVVPLLR